MTKSKPNPKVDVFLKRAEKWQPEMQQLRSLVLGCGLAEELKWGKPCYTREGSNIVLIVGFKNDCALMFCKGVLLKDAEGILKSPGENSQSGRWAKFTDVKEVNRLAATLKAYIREAIELEKAGVKVEYKKNTELVYPEEFTKKLAELPALKTAFERLTPGRRRAYNLFFSGAKQSKTRESRIEKCLPQILAGKGLMD